MSALNRTIAKASLYWHTLRWLKPIQFAGRAWRLVHKPRANFDPAPAAAPAEARWAPGRRPTSMLGPGQFRYLSETVDLQWPEGWNDKRQKKLWLYNLHYFDDLDAVEGDQRAGWHTELIHQWIKENPPGHGNGWEPYPASLRIVNWIKWSLRTGQATVPMRDSLAVQCRWLDSDLEHHLLGNHLWANAKALVFAGCYFRGKESDRWLSRGIRILKREIAEQILPDGGHFERSPMYHGILLEDLLDVLQLQRCFPGRLLDDLLRAIQAVVPKMIRWLELMSHPDGKIAFFNDAAIGIAPDIATLQDYARVLGVDADAGPIAALEHMVDSGYVRVTLGEMVAIMDVGDIGPDYLPGHAHADTFSFEMSIGRQRVFVNTGTSTYQTGTDRTRQRSTPAHNTVAVMGQDSSEVWGGFRVARRAKVHDVQCTQEAGAIRVQGWHDGYTRLPTRVRHFRSWTFHDGYVSIEDSVDVEAASATAYFHLAPQVRIRANGSHGRSVVTLAPSNVDLHFSGVTFTLLDGQWHPEFGQSIPNQTFQVPLSQGRLSTEIVWRENSLPQ